MKIWAVIQTQLVINTILWDGISPWVPPDGCIAVDITNISPMPDIGWTYDGTNFFPPVT